MLLGDPAYDPGRGLPALPGSGVEARTAASTLGAAGALAGATATAEAVRRAAPGASLLHLGTHGILDERAPNRSYLALAGDGQRRQSSARVVRGVAEEHGAGRDRRPVRRRQRRQER